MSDEELEKAIALIKAGNIDQGGKILVSLLKQNQQIERAWAWSFACVKTDDQRIYCLKKVLELNPGHTKAKAALTELESKLNAKPEKVVVEQVKLKRRRKPKPAPMEQEHKPRPKKTPKPDEPHVFNPNNYNIIFTKPGENLFAKDKRAHFPEIESGMYGYKLVIGAIAITPFDYPECVEIGHILKKSKCYFCDFFSYADCPFRHDLYILHETQILFAQRRRYWQEDNERRHNIIDAIYKELKDHGRPLHYEVLTKIILDRYPRLRLNPQKILRFMGRHSEKFEWVDIGVYKAK